jgi:hypothetical protein
MGLGGAEMRFAVRLQGAQRLGGRTVWRIGRVLEAVGIKSVTVLDSFGVFGVELLVPAMVG